MKKKRCSKCGKDLPLSKFYRNKKNKGGYCYHCKKCKIKYYNERGRECNLKRKYGITSKDYDKMLRKQNDKCAICGKTSEQNKQKLAVDHNHQNGKIRGLLCIQCNHNLLKFFRDKKELWKGFVRYAKSTLKNWD